MRGFSVFFATLLFSLSLSAQDSDGCKQFFSTNIILFRQFDLGSEIACLYESSMYVDKAVLAFFSKEGRVISSNSKLLEIEDVRNGINIPTIIKLDSGLYQMLWDYPNGVDVVELVSVHGGVFLSSVSKEMRLANSGSGEIKSIYLVGDYLGSNLLPFSGVTLSDVFNKDSLVLGGGERVFNISSDKAFLYSEPLGSSRTKSYLIRGDEVLVISYKSGFLNIIYEMKSGRKLTRWIDLMSII